jgi:hypothetical protein
MARECQSLAERVTAQRIPTGRKCDNFLEFTSDEGRNGELTGTFSCKGAPQELQKTCPLSFELPHGKQNGIFLFPGYTFPGYDEIHVQ